MVTICLNSVGLLLFHFEYFGLFYYQSSTWEERNALENKFFRVSHIDSTPLMINEESCYLNDQLGATEGFNEKNHVNACHPINKNLYFWDDNSFTLLNLSYSFGYSKYEFCEVYEKNEAFHF